MNVRLRLGFVLGLLLTLAHTLQGVSRAEDKPRPDPILAGYTQPEGWDQRIAELAKLPGIKTSVLGKSVGKRDIHLIMLGRESPADKPAILIVGDVEPGQLVGGELSLRMVKRWADAAADKNGDAGKATRALLDRATIYVIPRPAPDEAAKCFAWPKRLPAGNDAATDDDRDGKQGEDPTDDLNGDGLITMMRIADPAGTHKAHPDDPRVLIEVDPKKNERGEFRLEFEGRDDDGDERMNEDGSGGTAFDRNWTFNYKPFAAQAGPHQVSEPETRAVADFCFNHPNIAIVYSFSPRDNLFHPWKPENEPGRIKIKTKISGDDAPYADYVAELFHTTHGGKQPPAAVATNGQFADWAYFHFGRWSFANRAWWVPPVEVAKKESAKPDHDVKDGTEKKTDAKPAADKEADKKSTPAEAKKEAEKPETRGAEQLNALRWMEREKIVGFTNWTKIEHPDYPGKRVEVGGFHPLVLLNPPAQELDALAEKQSEFIAKLIPLLPQLAVRDARAESLGNGVFRLTLKVADAGYLPTMSAMGELTKQAPPLRYEWTLPKGTEWLTGTPRGEVERLKGVSGQQEMEWLVRLPEAASAPAKFVVRSPVAGTATKTLELKP